FETINAAGVMQVPLAISVWDDGWGISVNNVHQTTKGNISEILKGFEKQKNTNGLYIFRDQCTDYASLNLTYKKGIQLCRKEHVPVLFHIQGCTQPQGHSTSGSHERYKSPEQLKEEIANDCIVKMREWIISEKIASPEELDEIEKNATKRAREARKNAWNNFQQPLIDKKNEFLKLVDITTCNCAQTAAIEQIKKELQPIGEPIRKDIISSAKKILRLICNNCSNPNNSLKTNVTEWLNKESADNDRRFSSHLDS
ncbi:MAG: transketolase, partial [Bacteroidetes bacterium CG_4_9_14_3_um_filter_41_19]